MLCSRLLNKIPNGKQILPIISSQLQTTKRSIEFRSNLHTLKSVNDSRFGRNSWQIGQCPYCTGQVTSVITPANKTVEADDNKQQPASEKGILKRVLTKVGFTPNSKARLRVASHLLYESVADRINYLTFFRDFNLPNTFNSWFLVTELHVWMLLVRAMAEGSESGEDGRFLRNSIVEAMWSDVNTRAKKLGAQNPSRTRQHIEILSEQFQAALIAYDEGLMSDDRVLAGALWRRFFEMNSEDYQKIEILVKYVRMQVEMLDKLKRDDILLKPKIPWLEIDKVKV